MVQRMPKSVIGTERGKFKIAVLASGRGSNFSSLVNAVENAVSSPNCGTNDDANADCDHVCMEVCLLLSDNPKAGALDVAATLSIPTVVVRREAKNKSVAVFTSEIVAALDLYTPDLIVLAGFMRIVGDELIERYAGKVINIHPSLLPSFRGLDAQKQALEAGVKFAGCTVHVVTAGVDEGPILAQSVVPVVDGDTVATLSGRILKTEHILLPAVVLAIARGEVVIQVETVDGHTAYRVIHKNPRENHTAFLVSI